MMKRLLLLIASVIPLYAGTVNGIALLVKDRPVTLYDIRQEMRLNGGQRDLAVETLTRRALEAVEAEARGITVTRQEVIDDIRGLAEQNGVSLIEFYTQLQQQQNISEQELKAKIREKLLNRKLYGAIAYERTEAANDAEISEYYELNKSRFTRPESFRVIAYRSPTEEALRETVANPMRYNPQISQEQVTLRFSEIDPRLAALLNMTQSGQFSRVIPDRNGFLAFYVQEKTGLAAQPLAAVKEEITAAIMEEKRREALDDYFGRLRLTTEIKTLRLP